jgi:ribonuclease HI
MTNIPLNLDYTNHQPPDKRFFTTKIPSREEWVEKEHEQYGTTNIFTDGSKLAEQVGFGIFSSDIGINQSHRIPDYCSVFQAEVIALKQAAEILSVNGISGKDIHILTDSQAAVRALSSSYVKSCVVQSCIISLNEISKNNRIQVVWIPGHNGYKGNCVADELARNGSALETVTTSESINIPIRSCKTMIDKKFLAIAKSRWQTEPACNMTKTLWPQYDNKRSQTLINLNRQNISKVVGLITGHTILGKHGRRLNIPSSDLCRHCEDEEEDVSTTHLLCHCSALAKSRYRTLGKYFFGELAELEKININRLARFSKHIIWTENSQP